MISFERWKDGFVMTVEGMRVLRHSSLFPSLYLGSPKEKSRAPKAGDASGATSLTWRSLGSCDILNEGLDSIVLGFGSHCTIRISYVDRLLKMRFFLADADADAARPGLRLRFGAHPGERLLGAGPSMLYDMKGQKVETRASAEESRSLQSPTVFSSLGTWIHIDGLGSFAWRFGASTTELSCVSMPSEIVFGFGKTPAMGMELLTRYKGEARQAERTRAGRSRLPAWVQSSLVVDASVEFAAASSKLLGLMIRAGLKPCALIQDPGKSIDVECERIEAGRWAAILSESSARPLPADSAKRKSASEFGRVLHSLAFSGEGQLFLPIHGTQGEAEAKEPGTSSYPFETAAFGPLFVVSGGLSLNDTIGARRFIAAAELYAALAPYREHCSEEWRKGGLPVLGHPALRFQDDEALWDFDDEYMFGGDMLVAPTPEGGSRTRRLYLPDDEWVHLWTSRHYRKGLTVVDAPEGKPAVFYRSRSDFAPLFDALRQKATRL